MKKFLLILSGFFCFTPALAGNDAFTQLDQKEEQMLLAHQFEGLDQMAEELKRTDARLPGCRSALSYFYTNMGSFDGEQYGEKTDFTTVPFLQKYIALSAWIKQRPESVAARIAMAQLLINSAWEGRTGMYASGVSAHQWSLYGERLAKARDLIKELHRKDEPFLYVELMQIALIEPRPRSHLDSLYDEAIRAYPRFFGLYQDRADRLQTMWFGAPSELAAYNRSLLSPSKGDDGQIAYAFVAGHFATLSLHIPDLLEGDLGLSWPDIRAAYAVRERRCGLSSGDWNGLLMFALNAQDAKSAAGILDHIGGDWSREIWQTQANFNFVTRWVRSGGKDYGGSTPRKH